MEVKVLYTQEIIKIELGDIVVIGCNGKKYETLAARISNREYQFCLVHLSGDGIWSSAKTLEELNKDTINNVTCFGEYNYTIYKTSEYFLQLTQK